MICGSQPRNRCVNCVKPKVNVFLITKLLRRRHIYCESLVITCGRKSRIHCRMRELDASVGLVVECSINRLCAIAGL